MQIDTPLELPGTNIETMDTSQSPPTLSSLQTAAAAPLNSAPVDNSCSNTDTWETPPPEFFQEWKETASKPKAPNTMKKATRGPPGRLSPPNAHPTKPSTNRYAILQELPLTRPPVESTFVPQSTPSIAPSPASEHETTAKHNVIRSPTRPHTRVSRLRSQGIPIPIIPSSTPPPSPPTRQQAVLAFFTAKRALKKGSPQKKKAKTRPSSPSSDDMSTDTKETEWTWSNEDHTTTRHSPPTTRSHRHLLLTSDNFDSDTDSHLDTIPDNLAANSEQVTSPRSPDDYSEERPTHATHQTPIQDTSQTFHDSQGNEYNTAQLYTSPSAFDPYNEMNEDHDNASEVTTVLASDDEMDTNETAQQHSEDDSLTPSTSSPSTSIQYKSPSAGFEGNNG